MRYFLIICCFFGLTNFSIGQEKLSDSKAIRKTFSEAEIQDLQLLFDFFNRSICSHDSYPNLTECYQSFFKQVEETLERNDLQLPIPYDFQKKVYAQISDSTFYQIWTVEGREVFSDFPLDTFRLASINPKGKFVKFLKRAGKKDKELKRYYETFRAAGDLTPSMIAGLLVNHDLYTIADLQVKFVVAIHYLTLNDRFNRREKVKIEM